MLNIQKLQGKRISWARDIKKWRRRAGCIKKSGTKVHAFNPLIRSLGGKRLLKPTLAKMHQKLENGFALAVFVGYTRTWGHYFLIDQSHEGKLLHCVNLYQGLTQVWLTNGKFYRLNKKHTTTFKVWAVPICR